MMVLMKYFHVIGDKVDVISQKGCFNGTREKMRKT